MATTQTTQLSRGGQFSGWRMWALLAAAVALVATLAGRNVFDGSGQATPQPSVHNLLEGVDEFAAATARVFSPPRVGNLLEGVDENSTPAPAESAAADTAAASAASQTPHNLFEGVDASATAGNGTAGIGAYTMLKLEQAKGEETATGGQASPSEKEGQHNLVEGP